jgi:hypothetical protein
MKPKRAKQKRIKFTRDIPDAQSVARVQRLKGRLIEVYLADPDQDLDGFEMLSALASLMMEAIDKAPLDMDGMSAEQKAASYFAGIAHAATN